MTGPRIGELFAGYGGLGMGVKAVLGGDVVWVSDIDPGANLILDHRFPGVPNLGDITTVDWSQVEPVDVLTGGFPCQDVSSAGKRAGIRPGTRSGLWSQFAYAIDQLRPGLVVIENVRGLLSAKAHSDVEPCPWCLGDDTDGALRALGAVLGDLATLGYDASWHGLRAADVGAPHGRFRVFITAYPRTVGRVGGQGVVGGRRAAPLGGEAGGDPGNAGGALLPTPTARLGDGTSRGASHPDRRKELCPKRGGELDEVGGGGQEVLDLVGEGGPVAACLPLVGVLGLNDMGEGKTPDAWDEWTATMQARHGNGNGHGKSLAIEAQRLLPTPRAAQGEARNSNVYRRYYQGQEVTNNLENAVAPLCPPEHGTPRTSGVKDADPTEAGPGEGLRGLRDADGTEAVQRAARGPGSVPATSDLLTELREHQGRGDEERPPLASEETPAGNVPGVRGDRAPARTSPRPEPGEQRPNQPHDPLRELSPAAPLAGGSGCAYGCGPACTGHSTLSWGDYEAAIRRWEVRLGRPAPAPTQLGPKGTPRLSAHFCEWMMGLPAGWVTDVPGLTRNAQLKALGNGVCPQQAEAALRLMLGQAVAA